MGLVSAELAHVVELILCGIDQFSMELNLLSVRRQRTF